MVDRDQLFAQPDFLPPFTDLDSFAGQRFGVTGARGVLGKVLVDRFEGFGLVIEKFDGDVTRSEDLDSWMRHTSPDVVVHLAAVVPVTSVEADPLNAYRVNAIGAFNVVAAAAQHVPNAWLFFASSSHVYRPTPADSNAPIREDAELAPATLYGATKLAGEELVRPLLARLSISGCIGRIFSFSHRTQRPPYLVPTILERIAALPDSDWLEITSPNSVRDVLDAESVVDAVLHLAQVRYTGTVNIGSGRGVTIADIARLLGEGQGRSIIVRGPDEATADALVADVRTLSSVIARGES